MHPSFSVVDNKITLRLIIYLYRGFAFGELGDGTIIFVFHNLYKYNNDYNYVL